MQLSFQFFRREEELHEKTLQAALIVFELGLLEKNVKRLATLGAGGAVSDTSPERAPSLAPSTQGLELALKQLPDHAFNLSRRGPRERTSVFGALRAGTARAPPSASAASVHRALFTKLSTRVSAAA